MPEIQVDTDALKDDLTNRAIGGASDAVSSSTKGKAILGAGATGASIGAFAGPVGAVIGGGVGLLVGGVGAYWDDLFGDPPAGNNAELRKKLDAWTVPSNFDTQWYHDTREDVRIWANGFGLNDHAYVMKLIAYHYFLYGVNDKVPYPYKAGTNAAMAAYEQYMAQPKVNDGTFDWRGGQFDNTKTGFHTNNLRPNLVAGDSVYVEHGNFKGTFSIFQMGADDGSHLDSMFVIEIDPKLVPIGGGTWRKVIDTNSIVNKVTSKTGIIVIVLAALSAAAIFIYKKWKK